MNHIAIAQALTARNAAARPTPAEPAAVATLVAVADSDLCQAGSEIENLILGSARDDAPEAEERRFVGPKWQDARRLYEIFKLWHAVQTSGVA